MCSAFSLKIYTQQGSIIQLTYLSPIVFFVVPHFPPFLPSHVVVDEEAPSGYFCCFLVGFGTGKSVYFIPWLVHMPSNI